MTHEWRISHRLWHYAACVRTIQASRYTDWIYSWYRFRDYGYVLLSPYGDILRLSSMEVYKNIIYIPRFPFLWIMGGAIRGV
jgi:hypothetical protein